MHTSTILTTTLSLLVSTTLALPSLSNLRVGTTSLAALNTRQSCVDTCGTVCYYQSDIDAALAKGYDLYQNGQEEGSNNYPHAYNNYEGLTLSAPGPWQEFPILKSYQVYTGGSPGPDRVVFNTDGELAAVVTHTGASGNDFVSCSGN